MFRNFAILYSSFYDGLSCLALNMVSSLLNYTSSDFTKINSFCPCIFSPLILNMHHVFNLPLVAHYSDKFLS